MKMSEMYPSNWLTKEDAATPIRATIRQVTREEIKGDHGNETKNILHFQGDVKPLILNRGNAEMLCGMYGDDSVGWHGRPVEIYTDPNVMFGGKRVGGLRLRMPTQANGAGPNNGTGAPLWDVSDGTNVMPRQTTEQVQTFLSGTSAPLQSIRVKPAGAGRDQAQTADLWFAANMPGGGDSSEDNGDIPF